MKKHKSIEPSRFHRANEDWARLSISPWLLNEIADILWVAPEMDSYTSYILYQTIEYWLADA